MKAVDAIGDQLARLFPPVDAVLGRGQIVSGVAIVHDHSVVVQETPGKGVDILHPVVSSCRNMDIRAMDLALALQDDVGARLASPGEEPQVGFFPGQAVRRLRVAEKVGTGIVGFALVNGVGDGIVQAEELRLRVEYHTGITASPLRLPGLIRPYEGIATSGCMCYVRHVGREEMAIEAILDEEIIDEELRRVAFHLPLSDGIELSAFRWAQHRVAPHSVGREVFL